jgi:hypothetical protein
VINPGNRELMTDELDIVNGGGHGDHYCCAGPIDPLGHGNGSGGGLGGQILSGIKSVVKTIGGIIGL